MHTNTLILVKNMCESNPRENIRIGRFFHRSAAFVLQMYLDVLFVYNSLLRDRYAQLLKKPTDRLLARARFPSGQYIMRANGRAVELSRLYSR